MGRTSCRDRVHGSADLDDIGGNGPWKSIRIQGIGVGSRKDTLDLLAFLETHDLHPIVESIYPFTEAPAAFEDLDRGPFGKVVIAVE